MTTRALILPEKYSFYNIISYYEGMLQKEFDESHIRHRWCMWTDDAWVGDEVSEEYAPNGILTSECDMLR